MATTDSHAKNIGYHNGDNVDDYSVLSSALTVLASNRQDLTAEEEQALQHLRQQLRGLNLNPNSEVRVLQLLQGGPQQPQAAAQFGPPAQVDADGSTSGVSSMSTRDEHHAGGGAVVASGGGAVVASGGGAVGLAGMVPSGGGVGGFSRSAGFVDGLSTSDIDTVAGTIGSAPGTLGGFSAANDSASLPARRQEEDDEATRDTEESSHANP